METSVCITSALPEDIAAVRELLQEAHLPTGDLPTDLPHFFKATVDEKLVGIVGLELYESQALLRSLAVREAYRKQSVGKRLYETVVEHARHHQITTLYLLTETAEEYFVQQGFSCIQRSEVPTVIQHTSQFKGICPASATVMKRFLNRDSTD